MNKEVWRDIPGFHGHYQASSAGRIRSVDRNVAYSNGRTRLHEGQILKQTPLMNGYMVVSPYGNKQVSVHRLIATTFIPNEGLKKCVNHKDSDKHNNRVENLEWVTHKENTQHARQNNRLRRGQTHGMTPLSNDDVVEIHKLRGLGNTHSSIALKYGVTMRTIQGIIAGETWSHLKPLK